MSLPVITFGVGSALSFAVLLLLLRPAPASKATRTRLVDIQESVRPHATHAAAILEKSEPPGYAARLGALLQRFRFAKQLKTLLVYANSNMELGSVVVASAGAAVGCGLLCLFIVHTPLLAVAASVAGATIPYNLLRFKSSRRLKAFNAALPDAIDLMARSLLAGHSIGSSIEMVADQSPEPLAFEFVQVYQQQRLGLQFRDALLQMGERMPSRDLQFLVTAILVQKETGGDLTEILERASHVIRERVRIEGEVRTRTAQGRLTGWILALLPVAMLTFIAIVSPNYSHILFHDPIGQKLLYAGATLILIGGLIIRKIVDVRV